MSSDMETIKIRGYPKWQRIYAACVFGAAGIFFIWLYCTNPTSKNNWIAIVMVVLCFWLTAYWIRLPRILGVLTPEGMDYINEDLGLLFYYPWFHIDWNQVTGIQTFEQSGNGGPVMVTILHARDTKRPGKTRSFRINSNNMDYYRFLAYVKAVVDPSVVERNSLPLDPTLLRKKLLGDQRHKLTMLFLIILVLIILAYLILN
jgi:hypothetical protein